MDTLAAVKPGLAIVLIDFGAGVRHQDLVDCAEAVQIQLNTHLALPDPWGWDYGHGATCRAGASPLDVLPHEVIGGAFKHPDIAGALGYHDKTPSGQRLFKFFPDLDTADGVPWSTTVSHEVIELGDPECNEALQAPDGKFWAKENADAVEQDAYGITVSSGAHVSVSNFVLPAWYGGLSGKYDHMGLCTSAFEVRPGGYAQYYDPATGWSQVGNFERVRSYRKNFAGRRAKRLLKAVP